MSHRGEVEGTIIGRFCFNCHYSQIDYSRQQGKEDEEAVNFVRENDYEQREG